MPGTPLTVEETDLGLLERRGEVCVDREVNAGVPPQHGHPFSTHRQPVCVSTSVKLGKTNCHLVGIHWMPQLARHHLRRVTALVAYGMPNSKHLA